MRTVLLFLLTREDGKFEYDTYDSAVVAAYTEEEAREIHPGRDRLKEFGIDPDPSEWVEKEGVNAREIGVAWSGIKAGEILCASYNAG